VLESVDGLPGLVGKLGIVIPGLPELAARSPGFQNHHLPPATTIQVVAGGVTSQTLFISINP
jgi:hypothetical protein